MPKYKKYFLKNAFYPLDSFFDFIYIKISYGGVAKLVIALACQAGDRGFKSRRSRVLKHLSKCMNGKSQIV